MTTLDVIQRALQLATDSTQRIHLAVSKVRLLVKDSRFDAARALAESLLTAGVDRHTPYVAGAAGLAALLGRVDEAARIFGRDPETAKIFVPHGPAVVMPPQLTALASTLLSRAAFGAADDSIAALASTFSDLVTSYVPTRATADDVRTRVIPWALAFAYPAGAAELSGFHGSGGSAIDLLAALARGDSQAARRAMAPQPANLSTKPASTMDMVFLGARLALFVRDTAAAVRELDLSLRALPTLSPRLLTQVPETAALVRALALRAELAARAGDRETASRLATAVVTLWRNADPSLQPMVARLKQLATPAS